MNNEEQIDVSLHKHPCFTRLASCARIHLPVAKHCNIKCKYCGFPSLKCSILDKPGNATHVLTPLQAMKVLDNELKRNKDIIVAGIAGPGDPLANESTFETLIQLRHWFPELIPCICTNGLLLPHKLETLWTSGVRHLSVTVNSVDESIGENIYEWIEYKGGVFSGKEAAWLLMNNQITGIKMASNMGMLIKINYVYIPGVNDYHVQETSKKLKEAGAHFMNIIPLYPYGKFKNISRSSKEDIELARQTANNNISLITHCRRCPADVVGHGKYQDKKIDYRVIGL